VTADATARATTESTATKTLRRALLGLAAIGGSGAAADLAVARHWQSPIQLLPWVAVAAILAGALLLALRPSRASIWIARAVGLAVGGAGAFGVYQHVAANHSAGALDIRYADTWEQMSAVAQWWAAASGGVGPAPSLAPGVLAFTAAALLAATLHHMEEASP